MISASITGRGSGGSSQFDDAHNDFRRHHIVVHEPPMTRWRPSQRVLIVFVDQPPPALRQRPKSAAANRWCTWSGSSPVPITRLDQLLLAQAADQPLNRAQRRLWQPEPLDMCGTDLTQPRQPEQEVDQIESSRSD